jgi:hypothetical protein
MILDLWLLFGDKSKIMTDVGRRYVRVVSLTATTDPVVW